MFAILFSDVMDPFYKNITAFPTAVFTFVFLICLFFWIISLFGLIDLDAFGPDLDVGTDFGAESGIGNVGLLAGIFLKLGLRGVPLPIIVSVLTLIGWVICYYMVHFLYPMIPDGILETLAGIPILVLSILLASVITGKVIKPLRPLFKATSQETQKTILGKLARVRTAKVNAEFGEANVDDGGAGLIVKIRSFKDEEYSRGDMVVLLEYLAEENIYKVISEKEFNEP